MARPFVNAHFFVLNAAISWKIQQQAETEASSEPTALPEPLPEPNSPPEITTPAKVELADQPVQPKTEVVQSDYRGTQRQRIQVRKSADRSQLRRNVEGELGQRVDRIRRISSEVLDQAGYDPSLRFILVALFLFVLFLVILIMSKFIR